MFEPAPADAQTGRRHQQQMRGDKQAFPAWERFFRDELGFSRTPVAAPCAGLRGFARRAGLAIFSAFAQAAGMTDRTSSSGAGSVEHDPFPAFRAAVAEHFRRVTEGEAPHLFTTDVGPLYPLLLAALPAELRQHYTCSACRRFVERFGGLVVVNRDGHTIPAMWDPGRASGPFVAVMQALASAVSGARISGVFLTREAVWGQPQAGGWDHLAMTPPERCVCRPTALRTAGQLAAEKREDYKTLLRGLAEFPAALVNNAYTLLTNESLFRSEKCIGAAKWLLDLHAEREASQHERVRDNRTWLAVAGAPPGFCHVRSTMIGTLLEDLAAGLGFAEVKARFDAKMHPLQYQRPTAAPSAGNIAQAEKIIAAMKAAGSLERRFARLDDIQPLWTPVSKRGKQEERRKQGVFSHLEAKPASPGQLEGPTVTMTWEKFARTVLPTAEHIEYQVPSSKQMYLGMVTAKHAEAPPILQWDFEDERNPVSLYVYVNGSPPTQWNLRADTWHPVSAVTLQPAAWSTRRKFTHHGDRVIFILEGAKDREYSKGAGFFPEFLKSELHEIRSTLEAYAKAAVVEGKDEASACGICVNKGGSWGLLFRVTAKGGMRSTYKLDRWD